MEDKGSIAFGVIGITTLIGLAIGITLASFEVRGANNATVTTRLNVTNTEPVLKSVALSSNHTPSNQVDLNPGGTVIVNCTGYVWDPNGAGDIETVNATLYDYSKGMGTTEDRNYRYINRTCSPCVAITSSNSSCTCLFSVWYYANNGTWQCNMTVADSYNLTSSNISNNITINPLVALDVPSELDYGNLSVTETSGFIGMNISNLGNVPINISVRGWGGTLDYNGHFDDTCMICETGNISAYYEKYSINTSMSYANMTNLTNTSAKIPNFILPVRTNDSRYGNDTNTTYWRIYIPLAIGGYCNGTLEFTAEETA
ncbi:hypothetical protein KY366_06615 [Candidatus Woesearchaeota archaeon]|nr:hypothetical protein [Candidatus Woesearchaeota archaeon]